MKKICFLLCGLLIAGQLAFAHPPADIKIQFDKRFHLLTATIEHPVSNPKSHYINKVDIGLNGKEIQTLTFKQQDANAEQVIAVPIPQAKAGDVISVEGYCNQSGKLEKEIKVS
jgi:desulfoferrodoxin (superoxide reductase-like protein)